MDINENSDSNVPKLEVSRELTNLSPSFQFTSRIFKPKNFLEINKIILNKTK